MELNSMYEDELRKFFEDRKEKAFRGSQLFTFFHDKKRYDVENSNLSSKAIALIKDEEINKIRLAEYCCPMDGIHCFVRRIFI